MEYKFNPPDRSKTRDEKIKEALEKQYKNSNNNNNNQFLDELIKRNRAFEERQRRSAKIAENIKIIRPNEKVDYTQKYTSKTLGNLLNTLRDVREYCEKNKLKVIGGIGAVTLSALMALYATYSLNNDDLYIVDFNNASVETLNGENTEVSGIGIVNEKLGKDEILLPDDFGYSKEFYSEINDKSDEYNVLCKLPKKEFNEQYNTVYELTEDYNEIPAGSKILGNSVYTLAEDTTIGIKGIYLAKERK